MTPEFGELGVKPGSVELTSQKADRARRAIMTGDFAAATRVATEALDRSSIQSWRYAPFEEFIDDLFVTTPPELGLRLDEWVSQDGANALPLLLRAQYDYDVGWARRGTISPTRSRPSA